MKASRSCSTRKSSACRCGSPPTTRRRPAIPIRSRTTKLGAKVSFNADVSEKPLRTCEFALRPRHHVPAEGTQRRLESDPRRREASSAPSANAGGQEAARRSAQARLHRAGHARRKPTDKAITGSFQELKKGQKAAGRQAEFEEKWDTLAVKNYAEAKTLAEKALSGEVSRHSAARRFEPRCSTVDGRDNRNGLRSGAARAAGLSPRSRREARAQVAGARAAARCFLHRAFLSFRSCRVIRDRVHRAGRRLSAASISAISSDTGCCANRSGIRSMSAP